MNAVEKAQKVEADLRAKLADAEKRRDGLAARRGVIALEGLTGNTKLEAELATLHQRKAVVESEIEAIGLAIQAARNKVRAAEQAEIEAHKRAGAEQAMVIADRIRARPAALEAKMQAFIDELDALGQDAADLRRLGIGPTSPELFEVNMRTALETRLQFTKMRGNSPFLGHTERKSFDDVIKGYLITVERQANAVLQTKSRAA